MTLGKLIYSVEKWMYVTISILWTCSLSIIFLSIINDGPGLSTLESYSQKYVDYKIGLRGYIYIYVCLKRISIFVCLCCEICVFAFFVVFFPNKNCPPAFTETAIHDPVVAYVAFFQNCLRDWNRDEKGPSIGAPFFFSHARPLPSFFIFS